MAQKVWLVTGCSSGLGEKLIQSILARGDKAIATARNPSTLKSLAEAGAATVQLDVTVSQEELNGKAKEAVGVFGHVDVVVHNAGYMQMGTWEDLTHELLLAQFQTNFFGVVNLTRAMLPYMRERQQGTLVFINSTSRWQTYPGVASYGASKAALDRFVDGLTREVGPAGIKTLSLDVGAFESMLGAEHKAPASIPPTQHHGQMMDMLKMYMPLIAANPAIDVSKLANLIVDLVRGEGVAKGKEIPLRYSKAPHDLYAEWAAMGPNDIPLALPIGADAISVVKTKCEMYLRLLEQWEETIKSADTAGPASGLTG